MGQSSTRRKFLEVLGTSTLIAPVFSAFSSSKGQTLIPLAGKSEKITEDFIYTACGMCMNKCGMRASVDGDRVTFLEGNPAEVQGKGHLCAKGKGALGFLYDPDRLKYPMKRTNPEKGIGIDPMWKVITWDEALEEIANKINEVTEGGTYGERLMICAHDPYFWCDRLLETLGCPNMVTHYDTCFSSYFVARKATLGSNLWTILEGAKYILSFGWDIPARAKNFPTRQFIEAKMDGAKVVVTNPILTSMGAKADEYIAIKPGTDLAFALAMIHVILKEARFDRTFVENRTNFLEHEDKIMTWIEPYTPEWAEGICEVPSDTIKRISREFSDPNNGPALIPNHKRDGPGGPNYANSHSMAHSIIILNALVGAIDREEGKACMAFGWAPKASLTFEQDPEKKLPEIIMDKGAIDGKHEFPLVTKLLKDRGIFSALGPRLQRKDPHDVKMAIFRRYSVESFPNPKTMIEALKSMYIVYADTIPKDIIDLADIILPEPTFLESSGVAYRKLPTPGYQELVVANAPSKPLYDTKGMSGILCDLGRRLDEKLGTKYFINKETGNPVTPKEEKESLLSKVDLTWESFSTLPDGVYLKEVPYTPKEEFNTPSKKIEIYGTLFEQYDYDPLPVWREKLAMPTLEYPFYFLIRRSPVHKHTLTTNNPILLDAFPSNYALINTSKAVELGIKEGDEVYVESEVGKIKLTARLSETIRSDCIRVEHGFGHTSKLLTYAYQRGANNGELIPNRSVELWKQYKDFSAGAWMCDVCVSVKKVE